MNIRVEEVGAFCALENIPWVLLDFTSAGRVPGPRLALCTVLAPPMLSSDTPARHMSARALRFLKYFSLRL